MAEGQTETVLVGFVHNKSFFLEVASGTNAAEKLLSSPAVCIITKACV